MYLLEAIMQDIHINIYPGHEQEFFLGHQANWEIRKLTSLNRTCFVFHRKLKLGTGMPK